jgi:hypothetical protein
MTACLLKNEPASLSLLPRLRSFKTGAIGKPSGFNRAIQVVGLRPEARRSTHGQGELHRKMRGGPNPLVAQNHGMSCG